MEDQFKLGLQDLQFTLRRIESLQEWKKLFEEERKRQGPNSPRFSDDTQQELQLELAWFFKQYLDIQSLLEKCPADIREKWESKSKRVWQRYRNLLTVSTPQSTEREPL